MVKNIEKNIKECRDIKVARNLEEVESIRPIWEEMQRKEYHPVVNADIDRYLPVIKANVLWH